MRSEAYKLTGFTAVISALGFFLRWLQNLRIIDEETGLALRGAGISIFMAIFLIVVAVALAAASFLLLKGGDEPEKPAEALCGATFVHTLVSMIPAVLLAFSGVVQLFQANEGNWSEGELGIRRVCAAATLVAAYALVLVINGAMKPEKTKSGRVGCCLLLVFGAVWLIAVYKSAASDPVIWRFAVEVFAVCAALMAFFYAAGYFFDAPNAKVTVFFCDLGAFLCVTTCIDDHTIGETLCLVAVALMLLIWSFTITSNIRRTGRTAAGQGTETGASSSDGLVFEKAEIVDQDEDLFRDE